MFVNIPGLRNSDDNHWQTIWERKYPDQFSRIIQEDWAHPNCDDWINQIDKELRNFDLNKVILVGHSVGCATIINWFQKYKTPVKAVFLVAPSDVDQADYPKYITGFAPLPLDFLPFPSIVVASSNDHVVKLERAKYFAQSWGSEFVVLKNAGHIEGKSGFGEWPQGFEKLKSLNKNDR